MFNQISRLAIQNFGTRFGLRFNLNNNKCQLILLQNFVRSLSSSNNNGSKQPELPKPPENCCMSNCDNCVWIQYGQQLIEHFGSAQGGSQRALADMERLIQDPSLKVFIKMELDQIAQQKSKSNN